MLDDVAEPGIGGERQIEAIERIGRGTRRQGLLVDRLSLFGGGAIERFFAFARVSENSMSTARVEYPHEGDTLVVCFGSDASAIKAEDPDAVQRALRTFVPDIEVLETASHDWVTDSFSQGTWVHHRPGNLTQAAPRMREPHGRIHFAGGDIAPIPGGIEGAMESGAIAARRIAVALGHGA